MRRQTPTIIFAMLKLRRLILFTSLYSKGRPYGLTVERDRRMATTRAPEGVTVLLERWSRGDEDALNQLMPLVYDELHRLAEIDPQQGRHVELRFFGGLTIEETAAVMKVSHATVEREWKIARAWLKRELTRKSEIVS